MVLWPVVQCVIPHSYLTIMDKPRKIPGKCHQLLADLNCVLYGVKPALLVDYITPDAYKLQAFIQDTLSQNVGACSHTHTNHLCILTIKEDVLLVNMEILQRQFQHAINLTPNTLQSTAQETGYHSSASDGDLPTQCHCVYVDVSKGLKQPELVSESHNKALFVKIESEMSHWFQRLKTTVTKCNTLHSATPAHTCTEQSLSTKNSLSCGEKETPSFSFKNVPIISCDSFDSADNQGSGADELNLCALFGRLLGYPVVYWFDPEVGYSLEMMEVVCYQVSITPRAHSERGSLSPAAFQMKKEHILYSFTVPNCVLSRVQSLVDSWFHLTRAAANQVGLDAVLNAKHVCLPSLIL